MCEVCNGTLSWFFLLARKTTFSFLIITCVKFVFELLEQQFPDVSLSCLLTLRKVLSNHCRKVNIYDIVVATIP